MNQAEGGRVGAYDETGDDITEHHWLLETVKNNGDHACNQHDDRQVLNKADGMHDVILLLSSWAVLPGRPRLRRGGPKQAASTHCIH